MKRCNHNAGWFLSNVAVWVSKDGKRVEIFRSGDYPNKKTKLNMKCNIPECDAHRNVYLSQPLVKFGKVHLKRGEKDGKEAMQ